MVNNLRLFNDDKFVLKIMVKSPTLKFMHISIFEKVIC